MRSAKNAWLLPPCPPTSVWCVGHTWTLRGGHSGNCRSANSRNEDPYLRTFRKMKLGRKVSMVTTQETVHSTLLHGCFYLSYMV